MSKTLVGSWTDLEFLSGQPRLTERQARQQTTVQSRVGARGYEVRLSKLSWPDGGMLRLASATCWLNTILRSPGRPAPESFYRGEGGFIDGPVVLAPPDAPILVRWSEPEILVMTCLFDPAEIMSLGSLDWSGTIPAGGRTSPQLAQSLSTVSELMARELLDPDLGSEIKIESLVIYLAAQLHSQMAVQGGQCSTRIRLDARQLRLIRDLATSPSQPATAASIARHMDMAPRLLGQLFKATTGGTLRTFLAQQRIDQARRLLATPGLQIKKVAAMAGFSTTSAFTAAFRKSTGSTPQDFRASHKLLPRS